MQLPLVLTWMPGVTRRALYWCTVSFVRKQTSTHMYLFCFHIILFGVSIHVSSMSAGALINCNFTFHSSNLSYKYSELLRMKISWTAKQLQNPQSCIPQANNKNAKIFFCWVLSLRSLWCDYYSYVAMRLWHTCYFRFPQSILLEC